MPNRLTALIMLFVCLVSIQACARDLTPQTWRVNGVERQGLIALPVPSVTNPSPTVFVFHGHGGSAAQASRSLAFHTAWPEAVVVYLHGLPTPGRLTDPEGRRTGWQGGPGEQGDRDLHFFDVVWADLCQRLNLDGTRVFACGHSNGGAFTYLLWAKRRKIFAAFGPSAAIAGRDYETLAPAPVIHVAGENDALVKFAWQRQMISSLLHSHQCGPGEPRGNGLTYHPSPLDAPVVTYLHSRGHRYPVEATALIVDFFKAHHRR